jgi:RNA polymerase sigma-70 factor (ECF subfamily)
MADMLFRLGSRQFDQTVRAYGADLYRYAYWLARDRFVAEELVQETFARAWKNWDSLEDLAAVKPWLITILRNEHARLYERKRLDYTDDDPQELDLPSAVQAGAHLELEQLIEALPQTYREPLVLQVLGGYDCREIAGMLGTTEGAVMTRLTRARQALRAHLSDPARAKARS